MINHDDEEVNRSRRLFLTSLIVSVLAAIGCGTVALFLLGDDPLVPRAIQILGLTVMALSLLLAAVVAITTTQVPPPGPPNEAAPPPRARLTSKAARLTSKAVIAVSLFGVVIFATAILVQRAQGVEIADRVKITPDGGVQSGQTVMLVMPDEAARRNFLSITPELYTVRGNDCRGASVLHLQPSFNGSPTSVISGIAPGARVNIPIKEGSRNVKIAITPGFQDPYCLAKVGVLSAVLYD